MTIRKHHDAIPEPDIFEHVAQPSFWLSVIFIFAFWFFSMISSEPGPATAAAKAPTDAKSLPEKFTPYLAPYLVASSPRQVLTCIFYLSVLCLEIQVGFWVLQCNWWFAKFFFAAGWDKALSGPGSFLVFLYAGVVLVAWMGGCVLMGGVILYPSLMTLRKLVEMLMGRDGLGGKAEGGRDQKLGRLAADKGDE
ncbi:hypothetical protein B0O99DRAFT_599963 [Bisporella sp. PMI_857]|nr:hypothetical protein B0O99DRAFT_599963 [Bisporella sp. PMI_857]